MYLSSITILAQIIVAWADFGRQPSPMQCSAARYNDHILHNTVCLTWQLKQLFRRVLITVVVDYVKCNTHAFIWFSALGQDTDSWHT